MNVPTGEFMALRAEAEEHEADVNVLLRCLAALLERRQPQEPARPALHVIRGGLP